MQLLALLALLGSLVSMALDEGRSVETAEPAFHELWRQGTVDGVAGWDLTGVVVDGRRFRLAPGESSGSVQSLAGSHAARSGLALSPVRETAETFNELIPSWNAETPPGTWIEVRLRAQIADRWTDWYALGIWSSHEPGALRRSVQWQDDADARVLTDTLSLGAPARGYQLSLGLFSAESASGPSVSLVSVLASRASESPRPLPTRRSAWGLSLPVPERSQMVYPGGGQVWCSPTSTSMVMAYWARLLGVPSLELTVPEAAAATYDPAYRGHGNWPFNTAFAARDGLVGYVSRFSALGQVEHWIEARVPVVVSLAWEQGELHNAAISSTDGHLLVIAGFTPAGEVVVNDPAADPRRGQAVRRVYDRSQFERLWLRASGGAVYLIYPQTLAPPRDDAFGAW